MITKNKYGKGALTSTVISLLLNSFDLPRFELSRGWLALGELWGRKKLWFNEIPTG